MYDLRVLLPLKLISAPIFVNFNSPVNVYADNPSQRHGLCDHELQGRDASPTERVLDHAKPNTTNPKLQPALPVLQL